MAKEPFAAFLTTIWIGGFFFWMLKGFKGGFSDEIIEMRRNRNLVAGYLIQLSALAVFLFFIILKS